MPGSVCFDDVARAAERISGHVAMTPCARAQRLSEKTGAEVFVKYENQQHTGSFKERGALSRLSVLGDDERRAGVIAVSAGNHAQAVAYHAKRLGIPATIVMPRVTPFVKTVRTRELGANIVLEGENLAEAEEVALQRASRDGLCFIPPYDDPEIIAGQGTVALEMLEQQPDLELLLVPVGGGGLIAGCALAAKQQRSQIEVLGVQTELFSYMAQALGMSAGLVDTELGGPTVAEGIAVERAGELTCALARELVDDMVVVSEPSIEQSIQSFIELEKSVVEGAGAVGLAALLMDPRRFAGRKVGIVASGGNIDARLLSLVLMRGLVRSQQLVQLRIYLPDAPGALGQITRLLGECGANIQEVFHQRAFALANVKSAEVDLTIETRGADHAQEILQRLRSEGIAAELVNWVEESVHEPPSS